VYQIPFELQGVPIVNKFVARDMELKKMEEALLPRPTSHVRRKVFVLYGLGGVGKTQLAVEFARMHKKSFSAVFWLDGSTRGRVEQSRSNRQATPTRANLGNESTFQPRIWRRSRSRH
jgi:Cdc6-like AAA superfamily ATPase